MSIYENIGMTSLDYIDEIQRLQADVAKLTVENEKLLNKIAKIQFELDDVVSEWISIKDRLPEEEQKVLCFTCDGEMVIAEFSHFSYDFGELGEWHYWGIRSPEFVTHWMPLPQKPESEGEAATLTTDIEEFYREAMKSSGRWNEPPESEDDTNA